MAKVEVDAEKLRFVTDEGLFGFVKLAAPDAPDNFGGWGYTCEVAWAPEVKNASFKNALATLVESVTGKKALPKGLIRSIDDTERDRAKNSHLEGLVFSSFKKKVNPKERNLADPQERKAWIEYVKTQAPKLFKLNAKGERVDAKVNEIWSGCKGRVFGHCYYNSEFKKFCVSMDYVLLTEVGERIGGGPVDPEQDDLLNSIAKAAAHQTDTFLEEGTQEFAELPF